MDAKKSGKLAILLILPMIVLMASGCTNLGLGGDTSVSGNGVVITKFQSNLNNIESDDDVTLHLEVQNRGDAIAMAAAELIGIYAQDWNLFGNTEQIIGERVAFAAPDLVLKGLDLLLPFSLVFVLGPKGAQQGGAGPGQLVIIIRNDVGDRSSADAQLLGQGHVAAQLGQGLRHCRCTGEGNDLPQGPGQARFGAQDLG